MWHLIWVRTICLSTPFNGLNTLSFLWVSVWTNTSFLWPKLSWGEKSCSSLPRPKLDVVQSREQPTNHSMCRPLYNWQQIVCFIYSTANNTLPIPVHWGEKSCCSLPRPKLDVVQSREQQTNHSMWPPHYNWQQIVCFIYSTANNSLPIPVHCWYVGESKLFYSNDVFNAWSHITFSGKLMGITGSNLAFLLAEPQRIFYLPYGFLHQPIYLKQRTIYNFHKICTRFIFILYKPHHYYFVIKWFPKSIDHIEKRTLTFSCSQPV